MTDPFPADPDRSSIWTMPVERDVAAFIATDRSMVAGDLMEEAFLGMDGRRSDNPDGWRIGHLPYPMGRPMEA